MSLRIQDTFEPYYAGRKNPKPAAAASKERDAERKESAQQLAERAKRAENLPSADAVRTSRSVGK